MHWTFKWIGHAQNKMHIRLMHMYLNDSANLTSAKCEMQYAREFKRHAFILNMNLPYGPDSSGSLWGFQSLGSCVKKPVRHVTFGWAQIQTTFCNVILTLNAVEAQLFDQKILISDGTCSAQTGGMSCTNFGQARANKPLGHDSQEADTNTVLKVSQQQLYFRWSNGDILWTHCHQDQKT